MYPEYDEEGFIFYDDDEMDQLVAGERMKEFLQQMETGKAALNSARSVQEKTSELEKLREENTQLKGRLQFFGEKQ